MRYADIRKYDVSNWDGINSTIFFSGCTFNCPGCFNKCAQDFNYGQEFTKDVEDHFIETAKDEHVDGVCILGGEIFQQDLKELYRFINRVKKEVNKPIHIWSGYTIEEICLDADKVDILRLVDTLVDGRFILELKDLSLKYRGSSNQRVIYLKESIYV